MSFEATKFVLVKRRREPDPPPLAPSQRRPCVAQRPGAALHASLRHRPGGAGLTGCDKPNASLKISLTRDVLFIELKTTQHTF